MTAVVEISEATLNRLRDYVARQSLLGKQTTVEEVVERIIVEALDRNEASIVRNDQQRAREQRADWKSIATAKKVIAVRIAARRAVR